jgi:hypothetical protein
MKTNSRSILRDALALVTVRLCLEQLLLALLVFALFVLWLRVPDETLPQLAGSAVLGIVILGLAGLGESRLVLRLAGRGITPWRVMSGCLLVLAAAAIWLPFAAWIDHLSWTDPERAGYFSSQLPRWLRHPFPFERILLYLGWTWKAVAWTGAGLLAAATFVLTAAGRRRSAAVIALRSRSFWFVLLAGPASAAIFTGAVLHWMPFRGLGPEVMSLAVRLTVVSIFDAIVVCWLLASLAVCVRRADAAYLAPGAASSGGGPDESQPLTTEAP